VSSLLVIALRNVLRNRRRTLITLLAMFVGVGVMVSMRGLLNGLQRALVTNVTQGQTGAVQVHRAGYFKNVLATPLALDMALAEVLPAVAGHPGVTAVAPRIQFAGMVSTGDKTLFVAATAVDARAELAVCPLRARTLGPGSRWLDDRDGAILHVSLAESVGLARGAEAALLAPDRDGALSGENIRLVGTLDLQLPGEKKIGLVPLALAQRLLKLEGRATELAVAGEPVERADEVAAGLRARLGPRYEVHTWAEAAMFVRQAMNRQNFIIQLIAVAFMLLTLLGVANTMLMSVIERTREIGTMMAVGVRRRKILALFLVEALCMGALGGVLGSAAGLAVVRALARRGIEMTAPGSAVPFTLVPHIAPAYLAEVTALAALGAAAFALYPALRASRMRPVEALAGR
jgi:putative ABC transport system permease protein